MKLSEFQSPREAAAKLIDGVELIFRYYPRFMTSNNIDAYHDFLSERGERTEEQYFEVAYKYLASALEWIDIQDESDKDIPPTLDNLRDKLKLDMPTIMAIHNAVFMDIEKRSNPTQPAEPESSAGSTAEETLTQPTLPMMS